VTSRHNLWIAEFLPWFSCPDIFSVIPSATALQAAARRFAASSGHSCRSASGYGLVENVWFERAEIVRIGRGLGQWRLPLAAVESRRGAAKDTFLTKTQQFRSLCPNLNL